MAAEWAADGDRPHHQSDLAPAVQKVGQGLGHQTTTQRGCHVSTFTGESEL